MTTRYTIKPLDVGVDELPDWRIACCFVGKGHRRKGVAATALAGALERIENSTGTVTPGV